jgi:subtilisin family serine protease
MKERIVSVLIIGIFVLTSLTTSSLAGMNIENQIIDQRTIGLISEKIKRFSEILDTYSEINLDDLMHEQSRDEEFTPGELIIKLRESIKFKSLEGTVTTESETLDQLNKAYGVTKVNLISEKDEGSHLSNIYKISLPDTVNVLQAVKDYSKNPDVEYAEPNYIYYTCKVPNDPLFGEQWGLNQSSDHDIDAPEAWDIENGSSNVTIAILDTGIDYNHPDLVNNIWLNDDEIPDNFRDDDRNGYIDDVIGYVLVLS